MTDLDSDLVGLDFAIHKSIRYHGRRRAFLNALHRGTLAIVSVSGTATYVAILGSKTEIAKWVAFAVAVVGALDAVIGYAEHARTHDGLYRRFCDLAADMALTANPTEVHLREWRAQRQAIEKDEPTAIDALDIRCHNQEAEARGYGPEYRYRLRWWQSVFAQIITLPPNGEWKRLADSPPPPPSA